MTGFDWHLHGGVSVLDRLAAHLAARHRSAQSEGLAFYNRLVDELIGNGMEPFATLYRGPKARAPE